jgi:hypothetical protein
VIESRLTEVALSLDQTLNGIPNAPFVALTNTEIAPDLPADRPASVDWNHTFPGLAPRQLRGLREGDRIGRRRTGTAIECSTFHVNAPPVAPTSS